MTGKGFEKIIIVGAGPSGLLLALLLSKHGIPVTVVEMSHELDQQPRAAHYGPAATPDLKRAGVLDKIKSEGMTLDTMCWRRSDDHGYIAGFNAEVISNVDGNDLRTVCLPLQDLDKLMLDLFVEKYNGNILWKHKVVDVGQDEKKAWIDVETPDGNKRLEADYIIGCDGANSAVRRALFGNDYPGFTWDAQIIATNVSIHSISSLCDLHHIVCSLIRTDDRKNRPIMISRESSVLTMPTSSYIPRISL